MIKDGWVKKKLITHGTKDIVPIIFFILVLSEKTCKAAYLSDKGVHGSIEADLGVGSSDIERDFSAPAAGQEEITLEKSEGEINRVNCFGIRC